MQTDCEPCCEDVGRMQRIENKMVGEVSFAESAV